MVNSWLYSVHILLYFIESVATSNWSKHSMKYSTSVIKTEWTCTFLCKLTVLWWKRKRNSVILAILFSLCHWIIFVFAKWCYKQHPGHWFRIAQYQPQFIQDLLIFAFLEGKKKINFTIPTPCHAEYCVKEMISSPWKTPPIPRNQAIVRLISSRHPYNVPGPPFA